MRVCNRLLSQELPDGGFELIVADGMSTDGTREILRDLAEGNTSLRVIDNPGLIVSTGGQRHSRGVPFKLRVGRRPRP